MEEKAIKKSVKKEVSNNPEKLSYDKLNQIAGQLQQQNEMLRAELNRAITQEFIMRIEFMFKVVENVSVFDPIFVDKCVKEIEKSLTPPEETPVEG